MKTRSPIIDLAENAISKQDVLLLENKKVEIPEEVEEIKRIHEKYGIDNQTVRYINKRQSEISEANYKTNVKAANNIFISGVLSGFVGYKVITYATLNDICQDYALYIAPLSAYEKSIPDEILPSLDTFIGVLAENKELFEKRTRFQINRNCTVDLDSYKMVLEKKHYNHEALQTELMFSIAAPKHHFKDDSYNAIIGNELVNMEKPKFTEGLKFNPPKFETKDPIIFLPFNLLGKIYCIIVDAWDIEGDDGRLRTMI